MRTIIVTAILNIAEAFISCEDICKSQRSYERPSVCLCSIEDTERSSINFPSPHLKQALVMDDSSIFYEPLELSAYSSYFLKQPFFIHNPASLQKDNSNMYKKLKRSDTENPLEFINADKIKKAESQKLETSPFYLDVDIVQTHDNQQYFGLDKDIGNIQELEQNLMNCINLHILADFKKEKYNLDSKYLKDHHFNKYLQFSYSDLRTEIQSKCNYLTQVIKTSLNEIKTILSTKYIDVKNASEVRAVSNSQNTDLDLNNIKLTTDIFSVKDMKYDDSSTSIIRNNIDLYNYPGTTKAQLNGIEIPSNQFKDLVKTTKFDKNNANLMSTPSFLLEEKTHSNLNTVNTMSQTTKSDSNNNGNTTTSLSRNEVSPTNDGNVLETENTANKYTYAFGFNNREIHSVENVIKNETALKSTTYSTDTMKVEYNSSSYEMDILTTKYYDNRVVTTTDNDINSYTHDNTKLEGKTSFNYTKDQEVNIDKYIRRNTNTDNPTSLENNVTTVKTIDNKRDDLPIFSGNNLIDGATSYTELVAISVTPNKANESDQVIQEYETNSISSMITTQALNIISANTITKHLQKKYEYLSTTPSIPTGDMYNEKGLSNTKVDTLDSINNVISEIQGDGILQKNLKYYNRKSNNNSTDTPNIEVNNSNGDLDGILYFVFHGYSVPARFVQNRDGKIKLGIDGVSLCNKIEEKGLHDSIIISALCKCSRSDDCKVLKEISE